MINPGFVDTPLTEKNMLPMPGLMPVTRATRRMVKAIKSGGFEVTFPYRTSWPLKVLAILPRPLCRGVISLMTSWKARPLNYDRRPPHE